MPRHSYKSTPCSGTQVRKLPGVTIAISASVDQTPRHSAVGTPAQQQDDQTSTSLAAFDDPVVLKDARERPSANLSVKILHITSESFARRMLKRQKRERAGVQSSPAGGRSKRAAPRPRDSPLGGGASSPAAGGGPDDAGDFKTHRHFVEEMLREGAAGSGNAQPGVACQICGTRKTGQWRRGPEGPRTLCNVCSLAYPNPLFHSTRDVASLGPNLCGAKARRPRLATPSTRASDYSVLSTHSCSRLPRALFFLE